MPDTSENLKSYRRFRIVTVRFALIIIMIMAAAAFKLFDAQAAQGVLLGGIAGVLGFWIIAVRLEKLATMPPGKVHFAALTWTSFRFLLYGAVLYRGYTLDREEMHGLLGALAGILVIRFVTMFMGITGLEMPKIEPGTASDSSDEKTHQAEEQQD